ncbi:hypothetical protein [Kluyvera intermedia]|uniref:hypothetical protein n=1 Tax=Kluyvera intermedia TaxID=61648 RepID=UPI003524BFFA
MGFFMNPNNQIVLDEGGVIENEYLLNLKDDPAAFSLYVTWEKCLKSEGNQGKVLLAKPQSFTNIYDYVVASISCAITTNNKTILTLDNNLYASSISSIQRQRIHLLGLCHLQPEDNQMIVGKKMSFSKLDYDIAWSLERIVRLHRRGDSEDDTNDLLREYLLAKDYEVKDQTREGRSSSGKSAGEIDILIEDNKSLFSILEAMRLENINKPYILTHYRKLLSNYNPLNLKRLFLITYYEGKKFDEWWSGYIEHIKTIDYNLINNEHETTAFTSVENIATDFGNVRKAYHHGSSNGEQFTVIHYAVKLT